MRPTIEEVAKALKVSPLSIRVGLQQGKLPFGTAFKTKEDNERYEYILFPEKVREYIGELE